MVTVEPLVPKVGLKLVMIGLRLPVKLLELVADPALVVTVRGPSVTPAGTNAATTVEAVTVPATRVELPAKVTVVPLLTKLAPRI